MTFRNSIAAEIKHRIFFVQGHFDYYCLLYYSASSNVNDGWNISRRSTLYEVDE